MCCSIHENKDWIKKLPISISASGSMQWQPWAVHHGVKYIVWLIFSSNERTAYKRNGSTTYGIMNFIYDRKQTHSNTNNSNSSIKQQSWPMSETTEEM